MIKLKKIWIALISIIPISVQALSLECPEFASPEEEFTCKITNDNWIGMVANINLSEEITYSKLDIPLPWQAYYYSSNGFSIRNIEQKSDLQLSLQLKISNNAQIGENYTISLKNIEGVTENYQNQQIPDINKEIRIISNIDTLQTITISDGEVPLKFEENTLKYEVATTKEQINIQALPKDKNAKVEGDIGIKDLIIGANIFNITVTSERGNSKNYQIIVTRTTPNTKKDNNVKSGLKSLNISNQKIDLAKNKYSYTITVSPETTDIDVKAIANNNKASITIEKPDKLSYGENKIIIHLTEANGTKTDYILIVTREYPKDNNTKIKKLTIKDYFIDFKSDIYQYQLTILDEKQLELNIELESKTSKYKIIGNKDLKDKDKIEIEVTSEAGNSEKYTINIIKDKKNITNSKSITNSLKLPIIILFIILITIILLLKITGKKNQSIHD